MVNSRKCIQYYKLVLIVIVLIFNQVVKLSAQGDCDCTDSDQIPVENSSFEDGASSTLYNDICPPSWVCEITPDTGHPSRGATCANDVISHSCDRDQFACLHRDDDLDWIETLSQEIFCLTSGEEYYVSFSQSLLNNYSRSSGYYEVKFGNEVIAGSTIDALALQFPGAAPWEEVTLGPYTATSISMILEFKAVSNHDGKTEPAFYCLQGFPIVPIATHPLTTSLLLDGVSICGVSSCCDDYCEHAIMLPCDDEDPCTINDIKIVDHCDNDVICIPCEGEPIDKCQSTIEVSCDDGDPCTKNDIEVVASCDIFIVCVPCKGDAIELCELTIDVPCDDYDPCTFNDVEVVSKCFQNVICIPCHGKELDPCTSIIERPCDDGEDCTENDVETVLKCDESIECIPCAGVLITCLTGETEIVPCNDGDTTTINDVQTVLSCNFSICIPCAGVSILCETDSTKILPCNDGILCTINDKKTVLFSDTSIVCEPCMGIRMTCADGETEVIPCDDGDTITINDVQTILKCDGSICIPCMGISTDCDTGNTSILPCDDRNPCTENDVETVLDSLGIVCIPCAGTPLVCGDNSQCELGRMCDDGDPCTTNDMETILLSDSSICIPCLGIREYANVEIDSVVCSDDKATYQVFFSTDFSTESNSELLPFNNLGGSNYSIVEIDSSRSITIILRGINTGCDTSFIIDPPNCGCLAQADAGENQTIDCINTFVDLQGVGTSLGSRFTYSWTNSLGNEVGNTASFTTDIADTYTLKVTDNRNNCEALSMVKVDDIRNNPEAIINAVPSDIIDCSTSIIELNVLPQDNVLYTWNYGSQTHNGIRIEVEQSTVVHLLAYDTITFCSNIDSVVVTEDLDAPIAEAGDDLSIPCNEPTIFLEGTTDNTSFSIQWTTIEGQILEGANSLNPTVSMIGWYYLEVYNPNNRCLSIDSVYVNVVQDAIETIEYDSQSPICFGDTNGWIKQAGITGGTPPISYTINGVVNTDGQFSDLAPGNYVIEAIDVNGCTFDTSIVLSTPGEITLGLLEDQFELTANNLSINLELQTTATMIDTIIYQPSLPVSCDNCLNPELSVTDSGKYTITLIDQDGCVAITTFSVVFDQNVNIFIPNTFSPNKDGINDVFIMYSKSVYQISEFRIYNRWGRPLYQVSNFNSNETKYAWDGQTRGRKVDTGVYVYYFKYLDSTGKEQVLMGDLTVVY